jgi:hypothetical protein
MKLIGAINLFFLLLCYTVKAQTKPTTAETLAIETKLIGTKKAGIQFIWDTYGKAIIKKENETLLVNLEQFSKDKTEYCIVNGQLSILSAQLLSFTGTIKLYTKECCGIVEKKGTYTFFKSGKRKFYRLKEFNSLCSETTCAYYLDIFE